MALSLASKDLSWSMKLADRSPDKSAISTSTLKGKRTIFQLDDRRWLLSRWLDPNAIPSRKIKFTPRYHGQVEKEKQDEHVRQGPWRAETVIREHLANGWKTPASGEHSILNLLGARSEDHRNQGLGHWRSPGYAPFLPTCHTWVPLFPKPRARTSPPYLLLSPPVSLSLVTLSLPASLGCHHSSTEPAAPQLHAALELKTIPPPHCTDLPQDPGPPWTLFFKS